MSVLSTIQGTQLLSKKLSYDHSMPAKNPALVGKLDAILSNVCEMVQGQGHQDTASVVNEAIELLEHVPDDAFVTILSKIRAGGYCADYSKLEALYMDAIAFIGEPGALKVIAQEVNAGRVTGGRTALYTAALHLLTKPTAKHVAALTPIAAMEEPTSTLILAAASVVNKHCKHVSECENTPAVKNILNLLTGKLVKQCTASFSNSNPITVIATLKTLGNIGYLAAEHAEEVIKCAKTEGVETNVRFAATMVLKAAPCKNTVKSSLLATVLDQGMNTEVRIGSYLAAIKCADAADLQEIVSKITADTNKQVHSFVLSHLHNLKETNWPLKAHLQKLLVTMNIPTNYARNIFKYSRNIEMSYDTPILGVGAAVDSNVVFTPESYLPRLVNLGLDMNLLGSFVNIAEVGARVEGFDPIMKEVFGPESYLYKTPLSEIFKDSSLFIKQNGANLFNKLEQIIRKNESADIKSLIQSVFNFLKANNIKLPKTDLYAKLMGQEYAFLSVAGPMQEVNINHIIETMKSAVVDALVAAKDMNINTARAAHLHLDYAIPTIQGIPLKIKLVSTAVTGIQVQTKLDSKAGAHDALLKFIPSLSIAIDGVIGYGANLKHGLKMKNAIYSTNGLALFVSLKNGQDLELKVELPEKMELFNVKSEFYQVIANKLMDEEKIFPSNIKDVRIAKEQCFAIAEPLTGLNLCFKMNIPDIVNSNKLPLGMPAQFNIYLQKSEAEMKGYRVIAALKNKADKKVLKMVAGTYGSASSTESSVKLTYTKEANSYKTVTEVKSMWFTTKIEAGFIHQADLMTLQILANHKFKANAPFALACKFDVKKAAIAKGNEYQVTAFAGLTEALTETHKFLTVKMIHAKNGDFTNADLLVNVETAVLPITFGFGMEIPSNTPWFTVITKVELKAALGQTAIEGLVLRKMAGQYQNKLTIQHGAATVILLEATHTVTGKAFTSFNFNTEASAKLGNKEVGTTFTVKFENAVIDFIWELKNAGAKVLNINAKHSMESNAFTTVLEVGLPTLPKTLKFSNIINVVEFLNFIITTDLHMDNTALLHIAGPVALQFSKAMIKQNIDLKISGSFDGTIKVMNALLLSLEKTQFTLDMRHSTTPITMIDIIIDRTNAAETTAKAIIHVPVLVKAEFAAVVTSGLLHTTMNTFILPTTSLARRFKGYADLNLVDQNLKTDFYWDAEKDNTKKLALTTGIKADSSLRKVLVQGDLTVTTLIYGFKLEAMMASPFEWFLGTTGVELAVTAPSKKVLVAKALCTVEIAQSIVIFKPLMAVHTLGENKYEIAGSFAVKKLPALLNFEISSEFACNIPQLQKITIATTFLHEDKNGACAIVFKTGITGLSEPIALEVTHGASEDKYTTLFKVTHGTTVGSVATNVALLSGFKAFDITVDASLPFAVVKALSFRATKTAEGTVTLIFSKNQMVMVKLHYIMASLTAHTLSLECPSRTIEFFVGLSGNEMTFKVFPEKNLSPKMIETVLRVITKAAAIHMECLITAPSLPKEMRIAAEFSLADPTMEKIVNVDIHFPTSEFKTLVNAIVVELKKVYEDFVKDGVFPDMTVVYKELNLVLKELPKYLNTLKMQVTNILTKYWTIVKNWAVTMWKNYEADIIAFVKTAHTDRSPSIPRSIED
ncbi:unnamed protein product [Meganyctiphanes norvegica]|uniref:Vitellogenin domain-containing protein n=1 Tax=Meganyctiphanes norvegica TaxID=48144 RepID=A0AAV2SSJ4_MEGNR